MGLFFNLPTIKSLEEMFVKSNPFQHLNEINNNPELKFDEYGNPIYSPAIEDSEKKKKEMH